VSRGWAGPAWGRPSRAMEAPVPLRPGAAAVDAAYRADGGTSGAFGALAASVSGVSHRLGGRRGEDAWAWAVPREGRLVVAVADGVSGAGRGGEGADRAVLAACRAACEAGSARPGPWSEQDCAEAIAAASDDLVGTGGEAAAELSTTLVVALLSAAGEPGAGAGEAAVAQVVAGRVGDSSAFVLSSAGRWLVLSGGPADAPWPTATYAVPMPGELLAAAVETGRAGLGRGDMLVLATDGLVGPLCDGPETVAPSLASVLATAPAGELSPLGLARAIDFSRHGAHDDRAAVVVWPVGTAGP
jgi:serine/threonine protein phosphatase PrpC